MLTCYDASFARLLDALRRRLRAGRRLARHGGPGSRLDAAGHDRGRRLSHALCGARAQRGWLIADMPFGSYQAGPRRPPSRSAVRLMQAGAQMVKLEGGAWLAPTVAFLVERGIPVCAHLGLTPQSVHALGGYRIQGRTEDEAERLLADARALDAAGAAMLVLELVPVGARRARHAGVSHADDRHRRRHSQCLARCWCCTTCSTSIRGGSRASCATSWTASPHRRCRRGLRAPRSRIAASRRPSTATEAGALYNPRPCHRVLHDWPGLR